LQSPFIPTHFRYLTAYILRYQSTWCPSKFRSRPKQFPFLLFLFFSDLLFLSLFKSLSTMALSEYGLATLRFVYTSKLRKELQFSIANLRRTSEWSSEAWPLPQRLPRRAWRVSYLKRPFRSKITIRHYVFHDFRYQFTFRNVKDVSSTVSTVLGSMTPETSCVCHFNWHYQGTPAYNTVLQTGDTTIDAKARAAKLTESRRRILELEQGMANVEKKQSEDEERWKGWYGHSTLWNTGSERGPSNT